MTDLTQIEQGLTEARDALREFWEQGEGAVCFIGLQVAEDALTAFRGLDAGMAKGQAPAQWQRLEALADEVSRLRAPLLHG
jgi:hypothetical protein